MYIEQEYKRSTANQRLLCIHTGDHSGYFDLAFEESMRIAREKSSAFGSFEEKFEEAQQSVLREDAFFAYNYFQHYNLTFYGKTRPWNYNFQFIFSGEIQRRKNRWKDWIRGKIEFSGNEWDDFNWTAVEKEEEEEETYEESETYVYYGASATVNKPLKNSYNEMERNINASKSRLPITIWETKKSQPGKVISENGEFVTAEDMKFGDMSLEDIREHVNFPHYRKTLNDEKILQIMFESLITLGLPALPINISLYKIADEMVKKFLSGVGGEYESKELNDVVFNHQSTTKNFMKNFEECIKTTLKDNKYKIDDDFKKILDKEVQKIVELPVFDALSGLGTLIHDVRTAKVEMIGFVKNGSKISIKIRYTLYDNFGLDSNDLDIAFAKLHIGFDNWFILQHYENFKGKFKPFITKMEFEKDMIDISIT